MKTRKRIFCVSVLFLVCVFCMMLPTQIVTAAKTGGPTDTGIGFREGGMLKPDPTPKPDPKPKPPDDQKIKKDGPANYVYTYTGKPSLSPFSSRLPQTGEVLSVVLPILGAILLLGVVSYQVRSSKKLGLEDEEKDGV